MNRRPPTVPASRSDGPAKPEPDRPGTVTRADADTVMRTCPICGRQLAERKCKLYCPDPRCGYFLSCADYY